MLDLGKIQNKKLPKHQLNNQGCRCEMCQKLVKEETMKIVKQHIQDTQSEAYDNKTKEYYIKIVNKLIAWDSKPHRKLRYMLPELCIYQNYEPLYIISKKKETGSSKLVYDKTKLHMFEIIQFFLEGFVYHNPEPARNPNRKGNQFVFGTYSEKYKNQCMVLGKYKNNMYNMFTFDQLESLFKSRYKKLREGLLYLQTIIGKNKMNEIRININTKRIMQEKREMYERAKNEARIFLNEIKPSDMDFVHEIQEIRYENQLRRSSPKEYLEYLTLKIILIDSRNQSQIIKQGTFKYICSKGGFYIWDIRVKELGSSEEFWATGVMKAFEMRLQKRMSMMDLDTDEPIMNKSQTQVTYSSLGKKARDISVWLQNSTSMQWDQMKMIRNRLEKLQQEKKSLMQSQSFREGSQTKTFKIRNISGASRKN